MGNTKINQRLVRQLTRNSSGTSSISLPKEFIQELGWRKGQQLIVRRKGRNLTINSK
jgi:hypothetical protein